VVEKMQGMHLLVSFCLAASLGCASHRAASDAASVPGPPSDAPAAAPSPSPPPVAVRISVAVGGGVGSDGATAREAKVTDPFAVGFDRGGHLYFAEMAGERIRRVDARTSVVTTVAGTGTRGFSGDGGLARDAQVAGPHHLLVAPNDDLFFADTWNNRVRRIDARTGIVTTIAGSGEKGFSGDGGPATAARLGATYCLAADAAWEHLYVADLDNRRVREITLATGLIRTVAGNGARGVPSDDALAIEQPLVDPRAVAVDPAGTLYVLERNGHALRAVGRDGRIRTVAGTGQKGAVDGPARAATFNGPKHLAVDRDGSVLIVDTENHVLRRFAPATGQVSHVLGLGRATAGDASGPVAGVGLDRPHGVLVDALGVLWIADSENGRVLRLGP
jgi:DNA-binding beta-propeller fold protein YncE